MKILRYSIFALLLVITATASGEEYCYPIKGVKGLYSASFGEMRPNHFHSGVDIRTEGVEGKAVVAVADGYISRVAVSPTGYGLALYINHPKKGTMSVYAHLSRLRKDIADYLTEARYKRKQNRLTLFPTEEMFPVSQGDTIAFSGNSGSSFGPHLHFEIRDLQSGHTLNPVRRGVVSPKDTIAPKILRLHYIALDSIGNDAKSRLHSSYEVVPNGNNYTLDRDIKVGNRGYFALEVRDNRNGTSNRFGIYRATLLVDDMPHFEYAIDSFALADTRHCNLASFYPLQLTAKCEVLRLAKMPLAPQYLYNNAMGDGIIESGFYDEQQISIIVEDECGNTSILEFPIHFAEEETPAYDLAKMVYSSDKSRYITSEGFSLFIPQGALYEAECYNGSVVSENGTKESNLIHLSPTYSIFDKGTPYNKAVKARFAVKAPIELQKHLCVATVEGDGDIKYLGGEYVADSVEVVFRRGGNMLIVADTTAPAITPRFKKGADMRGVKSLSFRVKDEFSGVQHYALYIDNEWRSAELQPMRNEITHNFDAPLEGKGRKRVVRLEIEDRCGNKGIWQGTIIK